MLKELDHISWSIEEAAKTCDLIHVNSAPAITYSRYVFTPFVCTLHHPHETSLTRMYERYPKSTMQRSANIRLPFIPRSQSRRSITVST